MFKQRKGFTLIELLVVIAIIAVLAAILFPVFAKAREQARATSCLSNLKQIGTAMQMYLDDWDESYPMTPVSVASSIDPLGGIFIGEYKLDSAAMVDYAKKYSVPALLTGYVKSASLWKCPSDSTCKPQMVQGSYFCSYSYRYYVSYVGFLPDFFPTVGLSVPCSRNNFPNPAQTFIFSEKVPYHDLRAEGVKADTKFIFAFMDGHAKTYAADRAIRAQYDSGGTHVYDFHWPLAWDSIYKDIED